jgi:hypothetical protein
LCLAKNKKEVEKRGQQLQLTSCSAKQFQKAAVNIALAKQTYLPQGFFDQMQFINCFVSQKDLANLPFILLALITGGRSAQTIYGFVQSPHTFSHPSVLLKPLFIGAIFPAKVHSRGEEQTNKKISFGISHRINYDL